MSQSECLRGLPVDAKGLANLMLDWAEKESRPVTPMKLHKLIYFCHADIIVQFEQALVKQEFEAWDYGPIIPSLYAEFKIFGRMNITSRATSFDPVSAKRRVAKTDIDAEVRSLIYRLYSFYDRYAAMQLSDLSHVSEGPWRHARSLFSNGLNMDRRISNDMIARLHKLSHT